MRGTKENLKILAITILWILACNHSRSQVFFYPGPLAIDAKPVELGMVFKPAPGSIFTGIRFYKADNLTGYTVTLWDSAGGKIFSAPVATVPKGWTQVPLPAVQLPGQKFVVSFYSPTGTYTAKSGYFAADSTFPMMVIPKGAGRFLYAAGGGFPTGTFSNANYFVEPVLFPAGSSITGSVDTIRRVHDTTQLVVFRDTCRIDYTKADGLTLFANIDSLGNPLLPDGSKLKISLRYSGPVAKQFWRYEAIAGKLLYVRYTMWSNGAWLAETQNTDGTFTPINQ